MNLIGSYWSYYDLGIGYSTNSYVLFVLYFPSIFILLTIAISASSFFLKKMIVSNYLVTLITILISIFLVAAGFLLEVWRTSSTVASLDLFDFLRRYINGNLC